MLAQSIVVNKDAPYIESSEMTAHEYSYRTSLPAGYWRPINSGVPYSKSTTDKGRASMGTLEDYSQVDRLVAERSGDIQGFRETEDVAFIEGMGQTLEQTDWYGNEAANPGSFNGFSTFYNTISGAPSGANIIDGQGTGSSNLSFWLIGWAPRKVYHIFPRGSEAGLTMEDVSDSQSGYDSLGNPFRAYTMWFRQLVGLCIHDWQNVARIANIDVTAAGLAGPNALDIFAAIRQMLLLPTTMTKASSGITESDAPNDPGTGARWNIYTCRSGRHWMDVQRIRDRQVLLTINDYAGKPTTAIEDVPIRVSDQLLTTEQRVV
jgi:hypothetical protein